MRWDKFFNTEDYRYGKQPASLLQEQFPKLAKLKRGPVLDLAMAEGRNAVFLARQGFPVEGVDISAIALRKARRLAHENGVEITTILADLNKYKIKSEFYSVILSFDYLQRNLIAAIKQGLKQGGIIIFQYRVMSPAESVLPSVLAHSEDVLRRGELKELFKNFKILTYQEVNEGLEWKARLVAEKP